MKTITPITALLLLCLNLSFAQTYEVIDRIDWSQFADNTLSGTSENGQPWSASLGGECDANWILWTRSEVPAHLKLRTLKVHVDAHVYQPTQEETAEQTIIL